MASKIVQERCKLLLRIMSVFQNSSTIQNTEYRKDNWLMCKYHINFRPYEKTPKKAVFLRKRLLFLRGVMNQLYTTIKSFYHSHYRQQLAQKKSII